MINKKAFISEVCNKLRDTDARKPVTISKHKFFIRDSENNEAEFNIGQKEKQVLYNSDDVAKILEACLLVAEDILRRGDSISFKGFGVLKLVKRAARRCKIPGTEDWADVDSRYVPKFDFGQSLRLAARLYEMSLEELDEEERKKAEIDKRFFGGE